MKQLLLILFSLFLVTGCEVRPKRHNHQSVSWYHLSGFTYKKSTALPPEVRSLDGQLVSLSGYMVPLELQGDQVLSFVLVRDQLMCCFGKTPAMNEFVMVSMSDRRSTPLVSDRPVTIWGRFQASEERDNGVVISLFRLEAEQVEILQGTTSGWKAN